MPAPRVHGDDCPRPIDRDFAGLEILRVKAVEDLAEPAQPAPLPSLRPPAGNISMGMFNEWEKPAGK